MSHLWTMTDTWTTVLFAVYFGACLGIHMLVPTLDFNGLLTGCALYLACKAYVRTQP